jgi:hypothetical protein
MTMVIIIITIIIVVVTYRVCAFKCFKVTFLNEFQFCHENETEKVRLQAPSAVRSNEFQIYKLALMLIATYRRRGGEVADNQHVDTEKTSDRPYRRGRGSNRTLLPAHHSKRVLFVVNTITA